MRKLLIGLVVLVVVFIAADRAAVAVAQNKISDRIAAAYALPAKPHVTIEGFPFLTQVLAGDYHHVDISVARVPADGATLRDLSAHFTSVHASLSQTLGHATSSVSAERAAGTAVVPFAAVNTRLPRGLRVRPNGKNLVVVGTLRLHGVLIPLQATVSLSVTGSGIAVTPVRVTQPGFGVPSSVYPLLGFVVPLATLPLHLQLTSVRVAPGGLIVGAAARHVHFARA